MFRIRSGLRAVGGASFTLGKHSVSSHGSLNKRVDLPAVVLELRFQSGNSSLARLQRCPVGLQHPQRREQVIP
jgi:hypothetical protein